MVVTVKIPSQLRGVTEGEGEVEVDGSTVGEALDAVFEQHAELRARITEDGGLRRFVNVYVSGEDIRFQDGLGRSSPTATRSPSCRPSPAASEQPAAAIASDDFLAGPGQPP
jgi:molybdopterin converting factor small subunit